MRIVLVSVEEDQELPSVRTALRRPAGDLADDLAAQGHEVRELSLFLNDRYAGTRPALRASSTSAASLGLSRALEAGDFDVLHVIGERAGRLVEKIVGDRSWVWSYDEADAQSRESGWPWFPRGATVVVAPTVGTADLLARAGVPRSRLRVVGERLSANILRGPLDGVRMRAASMLTVMDAQGGSADVVRALSKLPGTTLGILTSGGDDAERRRLHLLARQLHVEDRVQWVPAFDRIDAVRAIESTDVLVHVPHERLDMSVVVTAMSLTTAVVVTDLPDADGVVVNGCTGLRVPAAEPHSLALRLSILSADAQMRDEVSLAARRFVRDELAPAVTASAVLETYARVVGLRESA